MRLWKNWKLLVEKHPISGGPALYREEGFPRDDASKSFTDSTKKFCQEKRVILKAICCFVLFSKEKKDKKNFVKLADMLLVQDKYKIKKDNCEWAW